MQQIFKQVRTQNSRFAQIKFIKLNKISQVYAGNEVERIERAIFLKGTISERADDIP